MRGEVEKDNINSSIIRVGAKSSVRRGTITNSLLVEEYSIVSKSNKHPDLSRKEYLGRQDEKQLLLSDYRYIYSK